MGRQSDYTTEKFTERMETDPLDLDHPQLSFQESEDGFYRLTIQLLASADKDPDDLRTVESLDVVAPTGDKLCRINLFSNVDGSWGDVDVILMFGNKQGRFVALKDGLHMIDKLVNKRLQGVSVYAVDIRDKDK